MEIFMFDHSGVDLRCHTGFVLVHRLFFVTLLLDLSLGHSQLWFLLVVLHCVTLESPSVPLPFRACYQPSHEATV